MASFGQCSIFLVALLVVPASSRLIGAQQSTAPEAIDLLDELEEVLMIKGRFSSKQSVAAAPAPAAAASPAGAEETPKDFVKACGKVTKAIVYKNGGSKSDAWHNMQIICSGLQYPPDYELCGDYTKTLEGHLHEDQQWNLEGMDYPLFCQGMYKVVLEHQERMTAAVVKVAPMLEYDIASDSSLKCFPGMPDECTCDAMGEWVPGTKHKKGVRVTPGIGLDACDALCKASSTCEVIFCESETKSKDTCKCYEYPSCEMTTWRDYGGWHRSKKPQAGHAAAATGQAAAQQAAGNFR